MNKQQLTATIWESANKMRSKIDAYEYKDYILGFIFYKFLSDKEVTYLKKEGYGEEDLKELKEDSTGDIELCKNNLGYYIEYQDLFSTWMDSKNLSKELVTVTSVREALNRFERNIDKNYEKVYKGIFNTLQTGLSKLGETQAAQNKAIRDLIKLIRDIPTDEKNYDLLGYIYENLIQKFASSAGKKQGNFILHTKFLY